MQIYVLGCRHILEPKIVNRYIKMISFRQRGLTYNGHERDRAIFLLGKHPTYHT